LLRKGRFTAALPAADGTIYRSGTVRTEALPIPAFSRYFSKKMLPSIVMAAADRCTGHKSRATRCRPPARACSSLGRSLLPLWYLPALTKVHWPFLKILLSSQQLKNVV